MPRLDAFPARPSAFEASLEAVVSLGVAAERTVGKDPVADASVLGASVLGARVAEASVRKVSVREGSHVGAGQRVTPAPAVRDADLEGPHLYGLERRRPGPELTGLLVRVDVSDVTPDALVELVAAWERMRSWAAAEQARAVQELTARAGSSTIARRQVSAELAARLSLTSVAADRLVSLARDLADVPEVAEALADGRVDVRRATILAEVGDLPSEPHRAVAAALVGTAAAPGPATHLTAPRIRERLRRAAIAHDRAGAESRHRRARADRAVRFEATGDCMAYLTALLSAEDAARARSHLDQVAVIAARVSGETRTLDQVRADTLVDLLTGAVATPSSVAAVSCGGAVPASGPDDAASTASTASTASVAPVRTVVHVTVAATTLLGLDDAPARLAGYGPIPAGVARELASDERATWRRILTDPVTGVATDVSRTTYRPGAVMGDFVRTRDATCTFPGCRAPAWRCDLDHVEPFAEGGRAGQTRADNLQPACRAHHNAKTHGGWSTTRDPHRGSFTWRSSSGHEYVVPPHVVDPSLDDHLSPGITSRRLVAERREDGGDDPPF
jgi:hypothetical protein